MCNIEQRGLVAAPGSLQSPQQQDRMDRLVALAWNLHGKLGQFRPTA